MNSDHILTIKNWRTSCQKWNSFLRDEEQLQLLELLWLHLNPGKPSHLKTAKVEVETKGLYDHSWSTTKDTPTDRAIPPAIDHPGAGKW